jgi:hypothetical protein
MTIGIRELLDNKQLPIDSSRLKEPKKQIPIGAVDRLANELVAEYSNPKYRVWYCKVIYEFGVERVLEWRNRALEGREPAKLFSKYVKDASTFRSSRSGSDG